MATTPKTVRTYALDGTKKDFTIPFEYLARKFVAVTLIGATRRELILNTEYRFTTNTTITTTKAWGPADNFDLIEIRRLTSATERLVDFADGSILRAYDLNISQVQSLHIAEEARDLTADTIGVNNDGDLDARARKIVNLADGVNDGDAVNMRQQKQWAGSALNSATASANSAAASEASRQASLAQANASAASASQSSTYATNSQNSASNSQTSRLASEAARDASITARDLSQAWASKAEDQVVASGLYSSYHYSRKSAASATASQTSATNSAASATQASASVTAAQAQADRAKTEADKLGNANAFMGSIDSVAGTTVLFKGAWAIRMGTQCVDNIYGNSIDKVAVRASTFEVAGVTNMANKLTVTYGGLDVTGAATLRSGLDVTGSFSTSGSATIGGALYATSVAQVKAPDAPSNAHLWFRDPDGTTERALIYADSGKALHIRANSGNSGGDAIIINASNVPNLAGLSVSDRTNFQNTIHKSGVTANPSMYGSCQLQLQAPDGSLPALSFHSVGRYAAALYLNSDNRLYLMNNGGGNARVITSDTFQSDLANLTSADSIGSYALMAVGGNGGTTPGTLVAGGNLRYSATGWINNGYGSSGTWRVMGCLANADGIGVDSITLCQRVG